MIDKRYEVAIDFLFNQLPVFQQQGVTAYKPGHERVLILSEAFGSPHTKLRTIHVAGTNGKGSTCHTLSAVLQSAGYVTGLFTSPHLVDFRERIRINGEMMSKEDVVDFVERYMSLNLDIEPSFFELTTIMAFDYFVRRKVDVAVVEVGLGGRLDSTNIITPDLSIITNISLDHTSLLGNTPIEIAEEKAGIIKSGVPVIIGEADGDVAEVFRKKSVKECSQISFAQNCNTIIGVTSTDAGFVYDTRLCGLVRGELAGECQPLNAATVLVAIEQLRRIGYNLSDESIKRGFSNVCGLTGLAGRWMKISENPLVICDTGHNPGGWKYISHQLASKSCKKHIVIGFVGDKDVSSVMSMLSKIKNAVYYFASPSVKRGLPADELKIVAESFGICGTSYSNVSDAYKKALAEVGKGDMVFVGGSNFVVGELLEFISGQ